MEKKQRTKRWKKRLFIWTGVLIFSLLQGLPAFAQVCPTGTHQSSPTSQICVKDVGVLVCPAGTLEAFPGSDVCLLDWTAVPKYVEALIIPPVMPNSGIVAGADYYEIAVRQFQQQILPPGYPLTTVWSYGSIANPATFNYPAFTIEAVVNQPTRVKWINDLVDGTGAYLPHLLGDAIDQTLHWANPPATGCIDGMNMTDCRGSNPAPYHGPVPIITHVHGAHVGPESDGYPEAWYLPNANNIPAGYALKGSYFDQFDRTNTVPGTAVFQYRNDQKATTLWYHDHALGITRLNVYAGPAGFWLLRDGNTDVLSGTLPGPAPAAGQGLWLPVARGNGAPPYREIPIAIQDRSFNPNGSLFYPVNRAFFEGVVPADLQIPFIPTSDISPIWNPEVFNTTMVVNGRTWPYQNVEPVRYRLRLLNGNGSRFLNLSLIITSCPLNPALVGTEIPFYQIGAEEGLLPNVVKIQAGFTTILPGNGTVPAPTAASDPSKALLMGNAERADVIVDFAGLPVGTVVRMVNTAPDSPFGGFPVIPANPATTGQVMEFEVVALVTPDTSTPPESLVLKPRVDLVPTNTRKLSLNELDSAVICAAIDPISGLFTVPIVQVAGTPPACPAGSAPYGPREAQLGTVTVDGLGNVTGGNPLRWMDAITETPLVGDTETWEIWNFTVDGHPVHLHLVAFQVVNREAFDPLTLALSGVLTPPEPWESGEKDTVIAYPGMVTRIRAKFDIVGRYVWHCHITEHEDNEMMRAYFVRPKPHDDYDGDGKTDVAIWRPGEGDWYVKRSSDGTGERTHWGDTSMNDVLVPGDYDGDGITDITVWRPGDGIWHIKRSSDGVVEQYQWGTGSLHDVPVPGDYDRDGKTDCGVWRPGDGVWYIKRSSDGIAVATQWGAGSMNDVAVPGDYDGDLITDIAVWRPGDGYWYILNSRSGTVTQTQFGAGFLNDVPVPGDYDMDGKTDIAVWRPGDGYWYILNSSDGTVTQAQWGIGTMFDVPVPGDYDRDGKTDIAVWRPGDGYWYILNSSNGTATYSQWGTGTLNDVPISD
ncbi:MAG: FG-GAP-like repeat-containing protein [Thermodesulfobacteriota bacterium]